LSSTATTTGDKPSDEYTFQPDNPLKDAKDCFETGKLKLAEGSTGLCICLRTWSRF
jgi:hypothetical protein